MPHLKKRVRIIEQINEIGYCVLLYHLIFLTDLTYNVRYTAEAVAEFQQIASDIFMIFLIIMFLGNIFAHTFFTIYDSTNSSSVDQKS